MIVFFVLVAICIFLYFRSCAVQEGFVTVAVDSDTMPICIARNIDAQKIFRLLEHRKEQEADELKLIIQKVLCIDADITGSGVGPFTTYKLPFATSHDIEPAASFVGRCVRQAVQDRDISMVMDTFYGRGMELIQHICKEPEERKVLTDGFHAILLYASRNITENCKIPKATLDTPAGPRDPGYYEPHTLQSYQSYTITGGSPQYL